MSTAEKGGAYFREHTVLLNKSHNDAVITNDVDLLACVCNHFLCYIYIILLWNFGGGGEGLKLGGIPVPPPSVCNPADMHL